MLYMGIVKRGKRLWLSGNSKCIYINIMHFVGEDDETLAFMHVRALKVLLWVCLRSEHNRIKIDRLTIGRKY